MNLRASNVSVWILSVAVLTGLLLAAPAVAQTPTATNILRTPEPATLTLLALGGGAAALGARFRKGRR